MRDLAARETHSYHESVPQISSQRRGLGEAVEVVVLFRCKMEQRLAVFLSNIFDDLHIMSAIQSSSYSTISLAEGTMTTWS